MGNTFTETREQAEMTVTLFHMILYQSQILEPFLGHKMVCLLQLVLSEKGLLFLQSIEASETYSLPGKGKKIPSPRPSSFLSSASFGEGVSTCGLCSEHSTVSGFELLPPEHHHEVVEGQAATGYQGGQAY
jgi:hypothetical protein